MTHKGAKIFSMIAGGLGFFVVGFLLMVVAAFILALFGVHFTGELTDPQFFNFEAIFGLIYIFYYMGVAFFFGFRWPDVSWKWGLWMSGGFFVSTLISWPIIQPFFRSEDVDLVNFYGLLYLVFILTIPSVILSSLGGYLGARYKLRRLQLNNP